MPIDVTIIGVPENDNDFSGDDDYLQKRSQLENAIWAMWEAGAPVEDIEEVVESALEDVVA